MKTFLKMFLAAILGCVVAFLLGFLILMGIGVSALSTDKTVVISPESVLKLDLNCTILERTNDNPFENYNFPGYEQEKTIGLNTLSSMIKHAKEDDNIKGIYLDISAIRASPATVEELRNYLLDFKTSGKFIYCYSDAMTQLSYYLATASDKIFFHPEGMIDFRGFVAEIHFYKKLLEKIELDMQIVRHGTYKSAVEPFMLEKMSEANREQIQTYLNSMWGHVAANISKSRSIDIETINNTCDSLLFTSDIKVALNRGFVDELIYLDQFYDLVREELKIDAEKEINWVSMKDYKNAVPQPKTKTDKIAIIYAAGVIQNVKGGNEIIGYSIADEIAKARKDKDVKAIVFRVNSGGGSALMSESIWREVDLARQVKPIVVSMGDYAASGGYYVSAASSYIVAQPTTITGSIGVLGIIPNAEKLLANKLGITVDRVKTNEHSDAISVTRSMDNYERSVMQNMVEKVYSTFVKRVADGRELTTSYVDTIGQGRVWSGIDALNIGLVDTLGGLNVAIEKAAQLAEITNYSISERPAMKGVFETIMESFTETKISAKMQKSHLYQTYTYFNFVESALELKGVQARIPYTLDIR